MMLSERQQRHGLTDLLNYAAFVAEGVCLLKDGALMAGFSYRGFDLAAASDDELAFISTRINQALSQCGDGWMLHADMMRTPSAGYPQASQNHFPEPTTQLIDSERRAQYCKEAAHYESHYTLIFTYQTPTDNATKIQQWLIDEKKTQLNSEKVINYFIDQINKLANSLSNYLRLERLTSVQLLIHLYYCITGYQHELTLPKIPVYLDTLLGSEDLIAGLQPKIGKHYIKAIIINGLPLESEPGILALFEQLPISYRWSNRFIFLDPQSATQELKVYRRNWFQKRHGFMGLIREIFQGESGAGFLNRDALTMTEDADQAIADADSQLVRFGYYTSVVVLMNEDLSTLEDAAKLIIKQLNLQGFHGRVETINAVEAYLGSLPGHGYENVRKPLIHTLNLADLIPTSSIWPGLDHNPCPYYANNSPPLLYAATTGSTPFRLNLHVNDVAHTLIKGVTGAGKSTLVLTIIAQFFRYQNAQVFLFDKGYTSYPLCKAMRGQYYDIGSEKQQLTFYPLQHIHEPDELNWACEWIEVMLESQQISLTPAIRRDIRQSLIQLQHHPIEKRTLTDFQCTIQNQIIKQALQYYTLEGAMGNLLDADYDSLREGHFQVFEMQHLMQKSKNTIKPLLHYLFHQIDRRLTKGYPSLIIIEEGHAFLDGYFGQQLETWMLEKRKQNTGIIFIDQSLAKFMQSKYANTLLDSCQTKIFLPDPIADTKPNADLYHAAGLSEKEIQILKYAIPKQDYYYTSPLGKRLINLNLGEVALSFAGVDSEQARNTIDELEKEYGRTWVAYWLRQRGLLSWSKQWEIDYQNQQQKE